MCKYINLCPNRDANLKLSWFRDRHTVTVSTSLLARESGRTSASGPEPSANQLQYFGSLRGMNSRSPTSGSVVISIEVMMAPPRASLSGADQNPCLVKL
jgi:hypothetical protein